MRTTQQLFEGWGYPVEGNEIWFQTVDELDFFAHLEDSELQALWDANPDVVLTWHRRYNEHNTSGKLQALMQWAEEESSAGTIYAERLWFGEGYISCSGFGDALERVGSLE